MAAATPSNNTPYTPPPTITWGQRPPYGGGPPIALGGWGRRDNPDEKPPVMALLYALHIRRLQANYGHRTAEDLESSLLTDLLGFQRLTQTDLLELDMKLQGHLEHVEELLNVENSLHLPNGLKDDFTELHMEQLHRIYERLIEVGATLRGHLAERLVSPQFDE